MQKLGKKTLSALRPEFTDDETELLAEMELSRWVIERLRAG
jgi:hypothetical protein